jgi:hypothetical protein
MPRPALAALVLLAACAQTDAGAPLPTAEAAVAANVAETREGHARDACRNAVQVEGLTVLAITEVRSVTGSGGMVIGSDVILRASRGGTVMDVRCSFTEASRTAVLSEV